MVVGVERSIGICLRAKIEMLHPMRYGLVTRTNPTRVILAGIRKGWQVERYINGAARLMGGELKASAHFPSDLLLLLPRDIYDTQAIRLARSKAIGKRIKGSHRSRITTSRDSGFAVPVCAVPGVGSTLSPCPGQLTNDTVPTCLSLASHYKGPFLKLGMKQVCTAFTPQ